MMECDEKGSIHVYILKIIKNIYLNMHTDNVDGGMDGWRIDRANHDSWMKQNCDLS